MKIVIVAPEQIPVPPILGGSVEITIMEIAKRLAKQHSVTIVSRAHRRYPKHSVLHGVHIHRVPKGNSSTYLKHVKQFLRGRKFDVLQIDNRPKFVGPLKSMFPNIKISLFLHSLTFVSPPYINMSKAKGELGKADLIIANSSSLKSQLIYRFPNISGRARVSWLGVDTSRFTPITKRKTNHSVNLLFAGRLIPRKGVPVFLKAAKIVQSRISRPIKVTIAGGSLNKGYAQQMKSLARKLHVKTQFLGPVSHRRIHRIYQQADIFVCPSQKHEAFGLVNVEAMSSGLPVVASDIGGIREVVEHGRCGFRIKNHHKPEAFASAIVRILTNKEQYKKMKIEARRAAKDKFSWTATAHRISRIYSSVKE